MVRPVFLISLKIAIYQGIHSGEWGKNVKKGGLHPSTHYVHLFYYKNKGLDFGKKFKNKLREQSQSYCHTDHKNKISRLSILKIKRMK